MRRIVLICVGFAVLLLTAAASAGAPGRAKPGYLVVQKALNDGGPNGRPAIKLVLRHGFVLGRITQEARVDIYHLPTTNEKTLPSAVGQDVRSHFVRWRGRLPGVEYNGSGFRFMAAGGSYRVVIRGAGVYLFAGGNGKVTLRGSSVYKKADGRYSVDAGRFLSLPTRPLMRTIGAG